VSLALISKINNEGAGTVISYSLQNTNVLNLMKKSLNVS